MDKLIEFALASWPEEMKIIILVSAALAFVASPIAIFWLFKKHLGRERYVFKEQHTVLYMLDTVSGRVFVAQGTRGFSEVHVRDFKMNAKLKKDEEKAIKAEEKRMQKTP